MDKSSVKITYLIAVRNKVTTIVHCLSSIVNQNPYEVVVIDGNSTDGTSDKIGSFPVLYLQDTGEGPARARNMAFEACTGDYVVIIDGDQWLSEGFNEQLKKIVERQGIETDIIFCTEVWRGSSIWARAHQEAWVQAAAVDWERIYRPRIFRSSVLRKVGGWNEEFTTFEDADLWERMKKLGVKIHKSELIIFSDASGLSILSEFRRGIWYGSRVLLFVRKYPSQWRELTSIAPIDFAINFFLFSKIFLLTGKFDIAFASLLLRVSRSIGWLLGMLFPS